MELLMSTLYRKNRDFKNSFGNQLKKRMSETLQNTVTETKPQAQVKVLLVEDDDDDFMLISEALMRSNMKYDISRVSDGVEAMEYLNNQLEQKNLGLPDLILLDLNMPKKNGHEVLREIKCDYRLKHIVTIVLTSSKSPADIEVAYESGANSFLTKSSKFEEIIRDINSVNKFWFETATRPKSHIDN